MDKKNKKISKTISNIVLLLQFITCAFLIYSIYLISGIENELRYIAIAAILIINLFSIVLLKLLASRKKKKNVIIAIIISLLLLIGQATVGYYVFRTYSSIASMNKDKITYESSLVTMTSSNVNNITDLKDAKIGIVKDETSIDGYILASEIINENNLEDANTVVYYDNTSSLISDLYNSKIDAILISKSYTTMFTSIEEYANIATDTKIITTKSKEYTKEEISNITGSDIENFNSSNSVTEPFTVLIMGIDSEVDGLDKNANGNGDALMVVTFNPKTLNATILSIPRDTYVPIACFSGQRENKITHAAWNGSSCMIKTIENFTGINIDYYVKINFKGVVQIVDALGGIDVDVPEVLDGVCEQDSNRNFANLQCFTKGYQTIDGEHALAMARHRKTLATGDIQRGLDQQIVVEGIVNKVSNITSANQALDLLNAVSKNIDTNFTTKQILSFYDIAKTVFATSNTKNPFNITQLFLSGSGQMIYDEAMGMVLYDYVYNHSSLEQDVTEMKKNLGQIENTNTEKTMDFTIEDPYEEEIIGKYNLSATKTYSLISDYTGNSLSYAKGQLGGININVEYQSVSSESGYFDGEIISQSLPSNKRIDLIGSDGITFAVAQIETTPTPPVTSNPDTDSDSDDNSDAVCSNSIYTNKKDCEENGETWN